MYICICIDPLLHALIHVFVYICIHAPRHSGNPSAVVVASHALYHAVLVQKILSNFKTLRVYTSQDVIGVQLGGALKNPLAVGAGMISGLGTHICGCGCWRSVYIFQIYIYIYICVYVFVEKYVLIVIGYI